MAFLRTLFARDDDGPRAPWRLFWVAFAVRLLYVVLARTWHLRAFEGDFAFGYEAGRIAEALVHGRGYSDPFRNVYVAHTGPTAWLPPLYPLLLAAAFRLFGVYSAASAFAVLAVQCILSAATALATWELGFRFARRTPLQPLSVARWAGCLWALHPAAMQYAVKWFWEMTLTCALFAWLMVLVLRMRDEPGRRVLARWAVFGALWGLIALSNSSVLAFLPVAGLWLLWQGRVAWRTEVTGALLAVVCFVALVLPWTLRNQRVFGTFIPLRGNFGAELYLGNGPNATGFLMEQNHPYQDPVQLRLYRDLGEVRYVRMRGAAARAVIAADRGLFLRNTLKRVYFFWISVPHATGGHMAEEGFRVFSYAFLSLSGLFGLALAVWRRVPAAGLWAAAFLLLPAPYYLITVHARFRHPLEPLIAVLGVYLFQSAAPRRPSKALAAGQAER